MDSLSLEKIITKSKLIGSVYQSEFKLIYFGISLLGIVGFLVLFVYNKNKNKHPISTLSKTEKTIIKRLLIDSNSRNFTCDDLNEFLQIMNKTYNNQRQIRNRFISSINQKLKSHLNDKDFICRSPNTEDKRMMDYHVNPDLNAKELDVLKAKTK